MNTRKTDSYPRIKKIEKESLIFKIVKLQLSLKPQLHFNIKFNLEKYIQRFFDRISEAISDYRILKDDEKRRLKLEKIENERKEMYIKSISGELF